MHTTASIVVVIRAPLAYVCIDVQLCPSNNALRIICYSISEHTKLLPHDALVAVGGSVDSFAITSFNICSNRTLTNVHYPPPRVAK